MVLRMGFPCIFTSPKDPLCFKLQHEKQMIARDNVPRRIHLRAKMFFIFYSFHFSLAHAAEMYTFASVLQANTRLLKSEKQRLYGLREREDILLITE